MSKIGYICKMILLILKIINGLTNYYKCYSILIDDFNLNILLINNYWLNSVNRTESNFRNLQTRDRITNMKNMKV